MSTPFFSSSWYRVSHLKPALRQHVAVHLHRYRRKLWYVLQDPLTGHTHRLAPSAYLFVSMMDGIRDVQAIWATMVDRLKDEAPTQGEIVQLLANLHSSDLLQTDYAPDANELFDRSESRAKRKLWQTILSPTSLKIPLLDPNDFLTRTAFVGRWLFSGWGALIWLIVVGRALGLAAEHWADITTNTFDQILAADNLLLLSVSYIVVKAIHELGHAYAVKSFGGDVHEMGVMLLVLFPAPYVDASGSTALKQKWRRVTVGAAGMLVELFVAACALQVWLYASPGPVHSFAFNIMVGSSLTTVLFNGNPFMRYDGYYILSDIIEMPNLAANSQQFWKRIIDSKLFLLDSTPTSEMGFWEKLWLFIYSPISFIYRTLVMIGISFLLMKKYFIFGVIMACWTLTNTFAVPVWRATQALLVGPKYHRHRQRTLAIAAAATAVCILTLVAVPFPSHVSAEGVVWLPDDAIVRAETEGFIQSQSVKAGQDVKRGQLLATAADPVLNAKIETLKGRIDELEVRSATEFFDDRSHRNLAEIELAQARVDLDRETSRASGLETRSKVDGKLVMADSDDLAGRFVKRGDIMAFVAPPRSLIVRAAVDQQDIDLVRNGLVRTSVIMESNPHVAYQVAVVREAPAAIKDLPSRTLGDDGGGRIVTDPRDPHRTKTLQRPFQVDLQLPEEVADAPLGGRVYIRFEHRWEPVTVQVYRRLRQMFLSRLSE